MSDTVMTFRGVLSGPQARGLLAFAGVPWNTVPAQLGAAHLGVSDSWTPRLEDDNCAPVGARGSGPHARGLVENVTADFSGFVVTYRAPNGARITRTGGGRDFRFLDFEMDYAPIVSGAAPVLFVRTTDTRCGEEVLFLPQVAIVGGLVTQAEVDRVHAVLQKTPEQLAIIRTRLQRQPALTRDANEHARRDGDIIDCIAQALDLPGSSPEWVCPKGFGPWFKRLYGTPLGKAVVWGGVALVALAVVPPLIRLTRSGR